MVTRAPADLHLVRCSIGAMTVGLEVNRIAAVERGDRLTRRPTDTAPGLFRTRQGDWPVYALAPDASRGAGGQVVLFDGARGRAGLLVDRVSPVERVPHEAVAPVPVGAGGAARAFSGVALTASGPLAVLAVDELGAPDPIDLPAFEERPDSEPARGPTGPQRLLTFGRASRPGARGAALAVPVSSVAEVFDAPSGAQLPGAPAHVREVVVWRERPLVVIDAARWVGLSAPAPTGRRVVVVRAGARAIGALAGSEVHVLSGALLCVPSPRAVPIHGARVAAVLDTSDRTLIVPDWAQLLGATAR